jgi:Glycosyl hydrolase catalytic core
MSVARAITAYNKSMQPFANRPGLRLVAPAITNAGSGFTWLSQFLGNATLNNLTVDVINIHWYASPYNMDYFVEYMQNASIIAAGRPVWITEYGMDNPNYYEPHVQQFMKNTTYWCDQQSFIERYAWFGDYTNNLLNAAGTALSARGAIWNSYVGSGYVQLNGRVAPEAKAVGDRGGGVGSAGTATDQDAEGWDRGGFVEKMWWKQNGHMDGK